MLRSSYTDIRSAYTTDGKNGWSYEGVYRLGLFQDYARLTDFEGYMHNASAPYKGFACEDGEEVAKGYGASVTEYLSAVLIESILAKQETLDKFLAACAKNPDAFMIDVLQETLGNK